jgi:hypothetical protein
MATITIMAAAGKHVFMKADRRISVKDYRREK